MISSEKERRRVASTAFTDSRLTDRVHVRRLPPFRACTRRTAGPAWGCGSRFGHCRAQAKTLSRALGVAKIEHAVTGSAGATPSGARPDCEPDEWSRLAERTEDLEGPPSLPRPGDRRCAARSPQADARGASPRRPDSTDRGFVFHQPDGSWLHPTPSATSSFAEPLPSAYQGSSSAPCATPGRRSPPDKASIRRSSKNALATAQSL